MKIPDKAWIWIVGAILTFIFVIEICLADPTTAPISNIVRIHLDDPNNYTCGTGFILKKGTVLTARHLIERAEKKITIEYSNGKKETVKKDKCRVSKKYDIASIKVKKDKVGRTLKISYSGHYIGKKLYTSGYPSDWGFLWITTGVVSSEVVSFPQALLKKVFLSDIDVIAGNSGSPVFDYTDRLVGIVSSKYLCITAIVSTEALEEFLNE